MEQAPKSLRLRIGFFGKTNTGKSSLLNLLTGQSTAIVSEQAGTTTDVVEKTMELPPVGPVVLVDTAGLDDTSVLGFHRIAATEKALKAVDVAVLVMASGEWGAQEDSVAAACKKTSTPLLILRNKIDLQPLEQGEVESLAKKAAGTLTLSCHKAQQDCNERQRVLQEFTRLVAQVTRAETKKPPLLLDLLENAEGLPLVVLVAPIDSEAPKGRLIMPQVMAIREALDGHGVAVVTQPQEFSATLKALAQAPCLVVCDSQVAQEICLACPQDIPCTTFSILLSRSKGDMVEQARGAARIEKLSAGDRVLIAEACTHHSIEDDIARVKIPRWIAAYTKNAPLTISHCSGKEYPENLNEYDVVIHCGGCMLTNREMGNRIGAASAVSVPITNYGMTIAALTGVLERCLSPFPQALAAYREAK